MQSANQKQRRAAIACIACRQSKIKCSGDDPCLNCRRRSLHCQFAESNSKILVSERYLRDLQKQAYSWQRATATKRPRDVAFPEDDLDEGSTFNDLGTLLCPRPTDSPDDPETTSTCNIWTSPFTLPSTVMKDSHKEQRKWIWLAPSSAWSFTARLIAMMTEKLNLDSDNDPPKLYLDGDIYPFAWNRVTATEPPDTSGLPSLDHTLYLFHIVRFHLNRTYRFFDEDYFVTQLHKFYKSRSAEEATEPRFWFVQFLLVLALGNAFLSRPRNRTDPPGSKYFARAMAIMPNHTSTGKDSLLAIEVSALAGLYLYAIDHREAAHVQVGHAIRIAQLEGLHTQLPEEDLGAATVARCRNLWWTLYIMDRHVSSSLGLPMTTRDCDISTLVNVPSWNHQELSFRLQVRLSGMLSFIIGTIYKTEKTQLGTFLEITRNILETMARHGEEIEKLIHPNFHSSMDNVPQETRHTILLYHQCVIIATRPLLLSVLKERLEKLGREEEEDWQKFLALPQSLISIGIRSAEKTLQTLHDESGLLETFLPFDLEMTYAAAIHLSMAHTLFPPSTDAHSYSQTAHAILDEMILCGNRVAEARKAELKRIEDLFGELTKRVQQEGLRTLTLSGGREVAEVVQTHPDEERSGGGASVTESELGVPSLVRDARALSAEAEEQGQVDSLDIIGISSYEFLSIVDQIDNPVAPYGVFDGGTEWLAGEDLPGSFS